MDPEKLWNDTKGVVGEVQNAKSLFDTIGDVFSFLFNVILWGVPLMLGGGFLINQFRDQLPDFITNGYDGFLAMLGNFMPFLKDIPIIGDAIKDSTARTGANMTTEQGKAALDTFAPSLPEATKTALAPHVGKMVAMGMTSVDDLSKPENIKKLLSTPDGRTLARDLLTIVQSGSTATDASTVDLKNKFTAGLKTLLSNPTEFSAIWADAEMRKLLLEGASKLSGGRVTTAALETFFGDGTTVGTSKLLVKDIGPIMAGFVSDPEKAATALAANQNIPAEAVAELTKAQAAGPGATSTPSTTTTTTSAALPTLTAEQVTAFRNMPEPVRTMLENDKVGALAAWATATEKPLTAQDLMSIAPMVTVSLPTFMSGALDTEAKSEKFIKFIKDMGSEDFQKLANGLAEVQGRVDAGKLTADSTQWQGAVAGVFSKVSDTSRAAAFSYIETFEGAPALESLKGLKSDQLANIAQLLATSDLRKSQMTELNDAMAALSKNNMAPMLDLVFDEKFTEALFAVDADNKITAISRIVAADEKSASSPMAGLFSNADNLAEMYSLLRAIDEASGSALTQDGQFENLPAETAADIENAKILGFMLSVASGAKIISTNSGAWHAADHTFKIAGTDTVVSAKEIATWMEKYGPALAGFIQHTTLLDDDTHGKMFQSLKKHFWNDINGDGKADGSEGLLVLMQSARSVGDLFNSMAKAKSGDGKLSEEADFWADQAMKDNWGALKAFVQSLASFEKPIVQGTEELAAQAFSWTGQGSPITRPVPGQPGVNGFTWGQPTQKAAEPAPLNGEGFGPSSTPNGKPTDTAGAAIFSS